VARADGFGFDPGTGRHRRRWTAYRTERPTGVAYGTWLLSLGELSCWLAFGLYRSDPRLIALGIAGATASVLMLARIRYTSTKPALA